MISGVGLIYRFYSESVQDELMATTNMMLNCMNLTVRGDYQYQDGMLLKGDINITDSTMLYRVKDNTDIDTTLFWGKERILTTIESESGITAAGTKADAKIADQVLHHGKRVNSSNVTVSGEKYIGYYVPLENNDHTVVGMVFAGKKKSLVYAGVAKVIGIFVIFSGLASLLAIVISRRYASRMVMDIAGINQYLKEISEGNLNAALEHHIMHRQDEIGEIGESASRMRKNLQTLIERDPLTKLYNRRSCNQKLSALIGKRGVFSVVMADIDWFKKINDQYGHDAGDYCLQNISEILQTNVGEYGFVARWGGEEFLLVVTQGIDKTVAITEKIQQDIAACPFAYEGQTMEVTMTFGVSEHIKGEDYEHLIKMADEKLYQGKRSGRNCIIA